MRITQSGFYMISDIITIDDRIIEIDSNLEVSIFDSMEWTTHMSVWEWSILHYYSFFEWGKWEIKSFSKDIVLIWNKAHVTVRSLNYSSNNKLDVRISTESKKDDGHLDTKILSFAWEEWDIRVDGVLKIAENTSANVWSLDEENIFLWESGKISWIPTLFVETNDMEAGHACRMERISDEKLFYLRSRGVERENALRIMLEAKINSLFEGLGEVNLDFHMTLIEDILEKIS